MTTKLETARANERSVQTPAASTVIAGAKQSHLMTSQLMPLALFMTSHPVSVAR